jgi:hypothetical protein
MERNNQGDYIYDYQEGQRHDQTGCEYNESYAESDEEHYQNDYHQHIQNNMAAGSLEGDRLELGLVHNGNFNTQHKRSNNHH